MTARIMGNVVAVLVVVTLAGCGRFSPIAHSDTSPNVTSTPVSAGTDRPPVHLATENSGVDGPVRAAAAWVMNGQSLLEAGDNAGRILDAALAPDAVEVRACVLDALAKLRRFATRAGAPVRWRQAVLATRIGAQNETHTVVRLWWVGVVSIAGATPPQAAWNTSTVTLTKIDGRWLVADESITVGPTPLPAATDTAATADELDTALAGFTPWAAR